uniref:C2H2-type domain-containing protein n=1 Tax=Psilocybe cubensis TaxID=181762 RepID=A0A8H8CQQ1_PSICU
MSSRTRKKFRAATFHCSYNGCIKTSTTSWGIQQHYNRKHVIPAALNTQPAIPRSPTDIPPSSRSPSPSLQPWSNTFSPRRSPRRTPSGSPKSYPNSANPVPKSNTRIDTHPTIDGRPCDLAGNYLPPNTKPPPVEPHNKNDFTPFATRTEFEMAEFLFVEEEMSAGRIDRLSQLLGANYPDQDPPFANHSDLYACIDSIKQGDIPWTSFSVTYNGKIPEDGPVPEWMMQKYEVWFRNPLHVLEQQIGNPTYVGNIDYAPKRYYRNGKCRYRNLMSGQWVWQQANKIAQDIKCHGSMFCPVIIGSDKTTVSVATGQNDFYPLYMSLGNIHNKMRRAHKNAVSLVGFLAIPRTSQEYSDRADFRKFRRQLFHTSLEHILSSLRPYMSTPRIIRSRHCLHALFKDGAQGKCTSHPDDLDAPSPRRSQMHTKALVDGCTLIELWDDYGIVGDLFPFTTSFPRADIHELLAPDLLHQIIKGTFKDHLVDWVTQYINQHHEPPTAKKILADIDQRYTFLAGLKKTFDG